MWSHSLSERFHCQDRKRNAAHIDGQGKKIVDRKTAERAVYFSNFRFTCSPPRLSASNALCTGQMT